MKKTPVTSLYVKCSYPLKMFSLAASDTCQKPADSAVVDGSKRWYRCREHRGQLGNGHAGRVVYSVEVKA